MGSLVVGPLLVAVLSLLSEGSAARAQNMNDTVAFEDLGLTRPLTPGARVSGLAGTYTAIADDAHAILYNPAGLARVRRVELAFGLQRQRDDLANTFLGSSDRPDLTSFALDYITGAYPIATYRGSLVVAFGVYRALSTDLDIVTRGSSTLTTTNGNYRLQQSGDVYSYNLGVGVDFSPYLSFGASVFLLDGTVETLTQFSFDVSPPPVMAQPARQSVLDQARADVDGVGAVVGLQMHPHRLLRLGLSVQTPTLINVNRSSAVERITFFFNALDNLERFAATSDVDYTLPIRVTGGFSVRPRNFLISMDVGYANWTQAAIDKKLIKDQNLRALFKKVVSVRAAVEYTVPGVPIRLRGGYAFVPDPLEYLQSDRIEDWCRTTGSGACLTRSGTVIERANIETERQIIAGGIGFLAGNALMVDTSYEFMIGKKTTPTLQAERRSRRVLVSTSYRF